ncbi:MAG: transposase [Acidobacteriota bacterium]
METLSDKKEYTTIPEELSEEEFNKFILPHLSLPKRGPKCKIGYHAVLNLIIWVLYTGAQWKMIPIAKDENGKPIIHYTQIYRNRFGTNNLLVKSDLSQFFTNIFPQPPSVSRSLCKLFLQS